MTNEQINIAIAEARFERDELREQNAKLHDIAELAIMCARLWAGSRSSTPRELREQLDRLKECAK
jgi:hypothetical protein